MFCLEVDPSFLQIGMCCSALASDYLLLLNFQSPASISLKVTLKPCAVVLVHPLDTGQVVTEVKLSSYSALSWTFESESFATRTGTGQRLR